MSAMASDIRNLRDTIIPKSDQLNADQLLSGPMTITVTSVKRGSGDDQPIVIHYAGENGRPYKPCKSMRKVLIFAWGEDGSAWVGRSMTLFNRLDVKFGGIEVGGIRISHLSDIDRDVKISLTATKGKKEPIVIKRLADDPGVSAARGQLREAAAKGMAELRKAWGSLPAALQRAIGPDGCPDEFKTLAQQADAKPASTPDDDSPMTVAEVLSGIEQAADVDALDSAYDMLSLVANASPEDRAKVTEAYTARRAAIEGEG